MYKLWVRAGTLNIGSADLPFESEATITLWGDNTDEYWSFDRSIEAGNKNFIVTGTANIYGTSRNSTSRLLQSAYVNQKELNVEPNLDWQAGDRIGIAATNMRTMDFDYCDIESYN